MSRHSRMTPAALSALGLLALGGLVALGPGALAQTAAQPSGPDMAAPGPDSAAAGDRVPVLAITSVEIMHSKSQPEISVVVARGLTSSGDWSDGELVPMERGTPPDDVLDLVFIAQAPGESAAPSGYAPMHAILPLAAGHPFKAVRVRGATNSVLLRDLQGTAEAKPPREACNPCIGRYFVAKGGTAPAGMSAGEALLEDDLPPNTRVIHAADGIADMSRNPNRLTILVGEDGRVEDAAWQ